MSGLFGDSLLDLAKKKLKSQFSGAHESIYQPPHYEDMPDHDSPTFTVMLRKKRRTALMRQILQDGGYSDLAKMIRIKED